MNPVPVPGVPIEQQPPDVLMAMCLWGEARGESTQGKLAVAHVIINRAGGAQAIEEWPRIRPVILKPLQFSSFNHDDPNRDKLLHAHQSDPISWGECIAVARLALGGFTTDLTGGAVNYLTTALLESDKAPAWAKGMKVHATIGAHTFGVA